MRRILQGFKAAANQVGEISSLYITIGRARELCKTDRMETNLGGLAEAAQKLRLYGLAAEARAHLLVETFSHLQSKFPAY
ncbi:MAG: hypothetical protein LBC53_05080 [Spirochaetaceae bacterium]|jgi:hypothetical protein|nr:hypothetical protein [Spirochaetaceae bacterium]